MIKNIKAVKGSLTSCLYTGAYKYERSNEPWLKSKVSMANNCLERAG